MSAPGGETGRDAVRRWIAIGVFAAFPWCLGALNRALGPSAETAEGVVKAKLLASRGKVDTVLIGDSRVMTLEEEHFANYGWRFFNMGLSGMSPEDVALEFGYARSTQPVRRVLIGLSFENMTERFPFEFSRYRSVAPFDRPEVLRVAGSPGWRDTFKLRLEDLYGWFPVGRAASTMLYLEAKPSELPATSWREDGSIRYDKIEGQIRVGQYDFAKYRDPGIFFNRPDFEARYLETQRLSPDAQRLFFRFFHELRAEGITAVLFETVTTAAFDRRIEDNPVLARLRREWRAFFRNQSNGCVRFLDAGELRSSYSENDFIDAVHYLGKTSDRLAAALAANLSALEQSCQ